MKRLKYTRLITYRKKRENRNSLTIKLFAFEIFDTNKNSRYRFTWFLKFFKYILLSTKTGNNSILVILGANLLLNAADLDTCVDLIRTSSILVTNLEIPIDTALYSLKLAKNNNGNANIFLNSVLSRKSA